MNKDYNLSPDDITRGIKRVILQACAVSTVTENPELFFITGGPGSGKTSIERFARSKYKKNGIRPFIIGSDLIAEFHPKYFDALEELPDECYRITRQFVRPATPRIFKALFKNKLCIINENTLDKGKSDIKLAQDAKDEGYRIMVAVMATDLYESRMSCYERDIRELKLGKTPRGCSTENQLRMYDSFINGIEGLQKNGLLDEILIFRRGKTINASPETVFDSTNVTEDDVRNAENALKEERARQRRILLTNPESYFARLEEIKNGFITLSDNIELRDNSLEGVERLRKDFTEELNKQIADEQR